MKAVVIVVLAMSIVGCASRGDSRNEAVVDVNSEAVVEAMDPTLLSGPIENLNFQPGDHRLDGNSRTALDDLIAKLNRYPDVTISLDGHTDNRGNAADNLQLAKRRVMSVVKYLVSNGVEPTRLKPYAYSNAHFNHYVVSLRLWTRQA